MSVKNDFTKSSMKSSFGGQTGPDGLFFDHNPLPMWVYDLETYHFLAVNHAAVEHYGYSKAQFLSMTIKDIRPGEDLPRLINNVQSVTEGLDEAGVWMHIKKDGTLIHVEIVSYTLEFDGRRAELVVAMDVTERRKAEMAIKTSERFAREAIDALTANIAILDETGTIMAVNRSWREFALANGGDSARVFEGANYLAVCDAATGSDSKEASSLATGIRALILGKQNSFSLEYPCHSLGEKRWFIARVSKFMDDGPLLIVVAHENITERKIANEHLREREEQFRVLFEQAPIGIGVADFQGNLLAFNDAMLMPGEYTREDIERIGNVAALYFDPQERIAVMDLFQKQGFVRSQEVRFKRKDGSPYYTLLSLTRTKFNGLPAIQAITQDITERKQAEDALRENEDRFRSYIQQVNDYIFTLNIVGQITGVNQVMGETLGYTESELVGMSALELVVPDHSQEVAQALQRIWNRESIDMFEVPVQTRTGETIDVQIRGRAIYKDGNIVETLHIARDITAQKLAEKSLINSEERFRALIKHGRDHISLHMANGELLWESPSNHSMLGYAPNQFVGRSLFEIMHPEDIALTQAMFEQVIRTPGETREGMFRLRHNDGSWRWIEATATNLLHETHVQAIVINDRDVTGREQVEAELRLLGAALESTANAIAITDVQGVIQWVNPACTVLTGYSLDEIIGQNPRILKSGMQDEAFYKELWETILAGKSWKGEIINRRKDHSLYTEEQTITPVVDASGKITHFIAVKQNITVQKQAQDTLTASETELRALFSAMQDVVLVLDREGIYRKIAPTNPSLLLKPSQELLGISLMDVFPPQVAEEFLSAIRESLATGGLRLIEYQLQIGEVNHWFSASITPMSGDLVVWVARDVTDRKHAEERIRNQLARLTALREIDQAIISTFDMRVSLNVILSRTMKLLGVDAATVLLVDPSQNTLEYEEGVGFLTSAPETASIKLGESYAGKAALERRLVQIPNLALDPNNLFLTGLLKGENFTSYYAMPLIVKGKVIGVLEVFQRTVLERDQEWLDFLETLAGQAAIAIDNAQLFEALQHELRERKVVEERLRQSFAELEQRVKERTFELSQVNLELEQALRVKDEFLANMSHELRTPLNAVIGLSDTLTEQTAGVLNDKQGKYVSIIRESGGHLLELINDILDLAKIESGQGTLLREGVDLAQVCQSSLRMIKQLASKKKLEVLFETDSNLGTIWADERRLKQMLVNLLSNAVKFTPEHGKVGMRVSGDRENSTLTFTVWDTGIGIDEKDLPRLFQPFMQLDSNLARRAGGTGLGLALVAKMAGIHGGSVNVDSKLGQGSQFSIRLPWEMVPNTGSLTGQGVGSSRAMEPETKNKNHTILLVEDTEDVIMLVKDYLEYIGFNVAVATDGVEGIAQAQAIQPSLILMDIQMPVMDGFEATRRIREVPSLQTVPIIALTALAMKGDRERCLEAGMTDYVSKPLSLKSLAGIIKDHINGGGKDTPQ